MKSVLGPVRQIAYIVEDLEQAARRHHEVFGSGPFWTVDHIPCTVARYRGEPVEFNHAAAYGQWGDVMVEFMHQLDNRPSPVRDMFSVGEGGIHHTAFIVPDLKQAHAHLLDRGFAEALYTGMKNGAESYMFDARDPYGHFIEIYEGGYGLADLYDLVADSAKDFDGTDLLRRLEDVVDTSQYL